MKSRNLSKSKYLNGLQCPRLLWIAVNDPGRLPPVDAATQHVFDQGHLVGELAHALFPGGLALATANISENLKDTRDTLKLGKPIFEAGFSGRNLYCRVDVLVPTGDGRWDIVEVKSTTTVKDEHVYDVAFQRRRCELSGLTIRHSGLMHLNRDYCRRGEIDPGQLFITEDITESVGEFSPALDDQIAGMLAVINGEECPEAAIGRRCSDPYACAMLEECWSHLPEHNVMTLYYGKKLGDEMLAAGVLDLKAIPDLRLNAKQRIQKESVVSGQPYVNKPAIRQFLAGLEYPLYLLDFETFATAVPMFDGTRPYQNIPFQYSVHVLERPGAEPIHHAFLAEGSGDPRPELLNGLKGVIGSTGSILAYYSPFEKARLEEMARDVPGHARWIEGVIGRLADLNAPFKEFSYYHPGQLGSTSLKKVMPALTGLGYESLEIAEGETASLRFMAAAFGEMPEGEREKVRRDLLTYCRQDTFGMIGIMENLRQLAKGG